MAFLRIHIRPKLVNQIRIIHFQKRCPDSVLKVKFKQKHSKNQHTKIYEIRDVQNAQKNLFLKVKFYTFIHCVFRKFNFVCDKVYCKFLYTRYIKPNSMMVSDKL